MAAEWIIAVAAAEPVVASFIKNRLPYLQVITPSSLVRAGRDRLIELPIRYTLRRIARDGIRPSVLAALFCWRPKVADGVAIIIVMEALAVPAVEALDIGTERQHPREIRVQVQELRVVAMAKNGAIMVVEDIVRAMSRVGLVVAAVRVAKALPVPTKRLAMAGLACRATFLVQLSIMVPVAAAERRPQHRVKSDPEEKAVAREDILTLLAILALMERQASLMSAAAAVEAAGMEHATHIPTARVEKAEVVL